MINTIFNFTNKNDILDKCIYASIMNAVMSGAYLSLSEEIAWDGNNYLFQNMEGIRGVIAFSNDIFVCGVRNEKKYEEGRENIFFKLLNSASVKVQKLAEEELINSEWSSIGDKFSDVGNAIKNFLTGVEDSIEGTVKRLLTLVADLGILYVYSECTQTVSGYVPEVLDQEVEKIKQKYEPLLKDPVNTIGGIGQSICDTADEKGVAYSSGYIVMEVVTALLADKGLDKLKNVARTGKTADNVADIAKRAGNAEEDAGKDVASAYGITNANPQFGKGGLPQYYVPDVQDLIDKGILIPVDKIK